MKNWASMAALLSGLTLCAAQPDVKNAQVTTVAAAGSLRQQVDSIVQAGRTLWIGWEVQAVDNGRHNSYQGCADVRRLEGDGQGGSSTGGAGSTVVLIRAAAQGITKLEVVSPSCHLDAGGLPFYRLTGVDGKSSVKFFSGLVGAGKLGDSVLFAIAIHRDSSATQALAGLAKTSHDIHLKEQSAFWLGVERGHDGFLVLKELASDPDTDFRKKLTFDVSQSSDPAAVDALIHMAETDASGDVRGQAIFWLAQKAGKKQAALIGERAVNDPDRDVKKKAVFALSQLPADESYQQLVKVAESNRDPAIRKDAIFWLGQSKDPRALQYLENILKR